MDFAADSSLEHLQAASIHARRLRRLIPALRAFHHSGSRLRYRIAVGPNAGRKALTLYTVPPMEDEPALGLVASIGGFSLNAGSVCESWQRDRLERLGRYITRPPTR